MPDESAVVDQPSTARCPFAELSDFDHAADFHRTTIEEGLQASAYFEQAGIRDAAERNGGVCAFWMGGERSLYQVTNTPLVSDDDLLPTTAAAAGLFGDFMGSLPNTRADRPAKRAVIERVLSNARFIDAITTNVRDAVVSYVEQLGTSETSLEDFCLRVVAYVDSVVPGVLDLRDVPLDVYLSSPEYGPTLRRYFEIASEVISKVHPSAMQGFENMLDLIREILYANFNSLNAAPPTNMIRGYFALWGVPFTRDAIASLELNRVKELATVVIATYDTTATALSWALSFLAAEPQLRDALAEAWSASASGPLGLSELVVLEAVRFSGGNPSALWRRTSRDVDIDIHGVSEVIPAGTRIWLDRYAANRDSETFPDPDRMNVENIRAMVHNDRDSVSSLLSRNRYEINSFNMINTERNPRKCPGRLFAVKMQAILLDTVFEHYDIAITGTDTAFRRHSTMPRPASDGRISFRPTTEVPR
ncbi:cytochrome P450 [Jatrophihabitans lederbergiae]|uniref:Cytochrome P450 n=1 Tax=Jatrophihabitans lederbergiae TaxID=3075547 RepID=A0ABU2JG03_9ACTN|nr:cytochrome P450 [Jatrophihabitans sp. DSM 44399]MDT0263920.1 cytochrome P450 [Jatrophihabitans sp. DSM 44399]